MENNIKKLIASMTLEEKASLCSGKDFWHLEGIERLGIPSTMVADGPHGLRKQNDKADHLGINESINAVCFPAASATAASFDRELLYNLGETLGEECQAENVSVLLGPAVNIKRSPLCGRNFEYFSEDPYLTSELATAYINGVQSKNIGTSIKHFAANNQEHRRMTVSAEVDERTLREIYLASFEKPVKQAKPWTVMCAYNRLNGIYASQNHWLLNTVLRDEWGFEGFVMTDWGACDERVKGLAAGQDLQMPGPSNTNDQEIVQAVRSGELQEEILDKTVERILTHVLRFTNARDTSAKLDHKADHAKAREYARESAVLLKNDGALPLSNNQKVAFIGQFAENPRYQGGGSSHINTNGIVGALQAVKAVSTVLYSKGYEENAEETSEALLAHALEIAKTAEAAVIFAGLPDTYESEGFDRTHMRLPDCQNTLIQAIAAVQPNTVVVLHNGSPIEMPWINDVNAVLECYLGGEAVGEAQVDLLFGKANPCGKLPETFPLHCKDNPSYLNFPGDKDIVQYGEGIFVGYRYYDKKDIPVLFPFGHGLSYTSFEYTDLKLNKKNLSGEETLVVSCKVRNTGNIAGKTVVQLYVKTKDQLVSRPEKELKDFGKLLLKPGETQEFSFKLNRRAFAYFDCATKQWQVDSGTYEILLGESSRNIVLSCTVQRNEAPPSGWQVNRNTTLGDLKRNTITAKILVDTLEKNGIAQKEKSTDAQMGAAASQMEAAMTENLPFRILCALNKGKFTKEALNTAISEMNQALNTIQNS